jgi:YbbR domain-containing protein
MNSLTKLYKQDLLIKIILLILAVSLWAYVTNSQAKTGNFPGALKIQAKNVPASSTISLSENYAELKIESDNTFWSKLQPNNFDVYIDANNLPAGTHELNVQAISQSPNVKILSIKPKTIFATIEPITSLELPIDVKIEGKPADNYVIGEYLASPSKAVISAPSNILLDNLQLRARLVLDGENKSVKKNIKIDILNSDGQKINTRDVTANPAETLVQVSIVSSGQNKTLGIKPDLSGNVQSGYYVSSVSMSPPTTFLTGSSEILDSINHVSTEKIDISNLNANKFFDIGLSLPDSVSANPNQVRVTVNVSSIGIP